MSKSKTEKPNIVLFRKYVKKDSVSFSGAYITHVAELYRTPKYISNLKPSILSEVQIMLRAQGKPSLLLTFLPRGTYLILSGHGKIGTIRGRNIPIST